MTTATERRRVAVAIAVAAALALGVIAVVLSTTGLKRTGTNQREKATPFQLDAGQTTCQGTQLLPKGTGGIQVFADKVDAKAGPLEVTVRSGRTTVARGVVPAPFGNRPHPAKLDRTLDAPLKGTVCVRNAGKVPVRLYGNPGRQMRFDWLTGTKHTWWVWSPRMATRSGLVKASFLVTWTFWAALVGMLVLGAVAAAAAWRALRA
jgi:hypothetical protein